MSSSDRERWNNKYLQREPLTSTTPDEWLVEAVDTIEATADSEQRRAVDIACGTGQNAVWLAQRGWQVDGVDISPEGLRLAQEAAVASGCDVNWIAADLDDWVPDAGVYDLVLVFRFLDRARVPRMIDSALKSGGWLVYETFSAAQLQRPDNHIRNAAFTLARGELRHMFPNFDVVVDREDVLDDRTVNRFLARRR